jgi:preprotein translocase subunit SecY
VLILLRNFKNIFLVPDLRKKLMFTLAVLAVYRFGAHVPIPGINSLVLSRLFTGAGQAGGFFAYLDLISGGALRQFSVFSLGMIPYINASIMMQLLTVMLPSLEQLSKEGEYGRRIINQYTRYLALGLSVIQGFGIAVYVESQPGLALSPGWAFKLTTVLIVSVGALVVMWLGEQINAHGIGNGSSMIIFAGIVAMLPRAVLTVLGDIQIGQSDPLLGVFLLLLTLGVVLCVVFLEKGQRKIPVHYAKRVVGQRVYGGQSSYIPLKINSAGVIPVIFAGSIVTMPLMLIKMLSARFPSLAVVSDWVAYGSFFHNSLTAGLIIFFAFFYTAIIFNPVELADNIRKSGGFIPGIRPGRRTAEYFDYILTRVGFPGAIYLATLAILPRIIRGAFAFPVMFDGVSLLIVIGVALDTSAQIESYLIERKYEGFLASGRLRGRAGR